MSRWSSYRLALEATKDIDETNDRVTRPAAPGGWAAGLGRRPRPGGGHQRRRLAQEGADAHRAVRKQHIGTGQGREGHPQPIGQRGHPPQSPGRRPQPEHPPRADGHDGAAGSGATHPSAALASQRHRGRQGGGQGPGRETIRGDQDEARFGGGAQPAVKAHGRDARGATGQVDGERHRGDRAQAGTEGQYHRRRCPEVL